MKIALVSYHCPPVLNAESILVWKTLRVLAKAHSVTVFTTEIGTQRVDPNMTIPLGVTVVRSADPQFTNNFLNRAANRAIGLMADEKILWAQSAGRTARRGEFDVLYSRSQPGASHIVALRMKRALDLPWVAQFSDPWASNPYHTGHTAIRKRQNHRYEAETVRLADKLIFPTIELQEMYEAQYPDVGVAQKSVVLPHHTSTDLYTLEPAHLDSVSGKLNLVYFGEFYGSRSPEPLLKAYTLIRQTRPELAEKLQFHFIGNIESKFIPLIEASGAPVKTGKMGYFQNLHAHTEADGLMLIDAPNPTGRTPFLPSKLIDYIGAQRPILGITEREGSAPNILREFGYPVIPPTDVEAIAAQLMDWIEHRPEASSRPITEFASDHVVAELVRVLEAASEQHPPK